jgi:hypothetical protein
MPVETKVEDVEPTFESLSILRTGSRQPKLKSENSPLPPFSMQKK